MLHISAKSDLDRCDMIIIKDLNAFNATQSNCITERLQRIEVFTNWTAKSLLRYDND